MSDDGVLRSYNSKEEVVDYRQLTPEEIETLVKSTESFLSDQDFRMVAKVMEGVDGRDVMDMDQILNPPPHLRPPKKPSAEH